jgi:hypothetical protein
VRGADAVAPAPGRRQQAERAPADCAGGPPRGGIERRLRGHTTTPCVGPQRPCVGGDARRVGKTGTAGSSRHWTAALEATQRPPAIEDGGGAVRLIDRPGIRGCAPQTGACAREFAGVHGG